MASILPFVRNKSDFDDEATRLMGEAFDAVCKDLQRHRTTRSGPRNHRQPHY